MRNKHKKEKRPRVSKTSFESRHTFRGGDDDVPFFASRYGDDHKSQNRMSRYAKKKNENKKAVVCIDNGEDKNERSSEGLQQDNNQNKRENERDAGLPPSLLTDAVPDSTVPMQSSHDPRRQMAILPASQLPSTALKTCPSDGRDIPASVNRTARKRSQSCGYPFGGFF
jgi:hypothetical protein